MKPDISIIGRIKALKSTPDAAERKNGKAEIVYLDDADRKKTSRIILGKEDYDLAIEAHRRGLLVKVEGTTSEETKNTYNAISISILEACNPTVRLRKRVNAQRYGIRVLYGIC